MPLERASVDHLFYPEEDEITSRAGVIPYTRLVLDDPDAGDDGEEYWLMGTLPSGRLSDFGGQCFTPDRETPYECLLREVDEESNGLLTLLVQQELDNAFELYTDKGQESERVHVWKWVNRRRPEDVSYLVFVELDYDDTLEAIQNFTGNVENASIEWWRKEELDAMPIKSFNTNIQKFLRQFR